MSAEHWLHSPRPTLCVVLPLLLHFLRRCQPSLDGACTGLLTRRLLVAAGHQLRVSIALRSLVQATLELQKQQAADAVALWEQQQQRRQGGGSGSGDSSGPIASQQPEAQHGRLPDLPGTPTQQAAGAEGAAAAASPAAAGASSSVTPAPGIQPLAGSSSPQSRLGPDGEPPRQQTPQQGSAATASPVSAAAGEAAASPAPLPPQPPRTRLQAVLHPLVEAAVYLASVVLWVLLSPAAGAARDTAWVVLAVVIPPALAVWGRRLLWALLLVAAALLLAADRQWRLLALLGAAAAAVEAVAGLAWWQASLPAAPTPAPW